MSTPTQPTDPYVFEGGFPTPETIQRAYDEADLNRAVQTFRFFYPSVSMMAIWKGNLAGGVAPNQVFAVLEGTPRQLVFTPNSDTPYSGLLVDLSAGPMVVELPPGLLMGTANDLNQRWVLDLGLPGPTRGRAASTCCFPPVGMGRYRRATRPPPPPTGSWSWSGPCPKAGTWRRPPN